MFAARIGHAGKNNMRNTVTDMRDFGERQLWIRVFLLRNLALKNCSEH